MVNKNQQWVCIAVAFFLCFPSLNPAIGTITRFLLGETTKISTYVIYIIYLFLMIYVSYKNIRRMSVGTLAITLFLILSFAFSIVANSILPYMWTSFGDLTANPLYLFLLYGFWGLILAQYIRDMEMLCLWLDKFSFVTVLLALVQYLLALQNNTSPQYMVFSYNLLFPAGYLSLRCMTSCRLTRLVGMIVGAGLILIAGCRGALVCYLCSIFLFVLFSEGISKNAKVALYFVMFVTIVFVTFFWNEMISSLINILNSIGIDSRTLTQLLNQTFFDDSGRSAVQKIVIANIGLLPKGLYFDRIVANGSYAHNLILELLLEYGYLLGGLIIVWLCFYMIRSVYIARKDLDASVVLYTLIACGFLRLMFSGSYLLNEAGFWLLLGMIQNPYVYGARKSSLMDS